MVADFLTQWLLTNISVAGLHSGDPEPASVHLQNVGVQCLVLNNYLQTVSCCPDSLTQEIMRRIEIETR